MTCYKRVVSKITSSFPVRLSYDFFPRRSSNFLVNTGLLVSCIVFQFFLLSNIGYSIDMIFSSIFSYQVIPLQSGTRNRCEAECRLDS